MAIVANQPPAMLGVLQEFGVDRRLQSIVLDSLVGVSKPDPAIYELALAQLGVRPEHALMVGDRLDNDITPAARVGLATAWIRAFPISHTLPVALATTDWVRRYLADPRLRQRQDRFQAKPDVTAERLLDLVEG
jgi:FMN phosphatase YigB (HAD superfamily)